MYIMTVHDILNVFYNIFQFDDHSLFKVSPLTCIVSSTVNTKFLKRIPISLHMNLLQLNTSAAFLSHKYLVFCIYAIYCKFKKRFHKQNGFFIFRLDCSSIFLYTIFRYLQHKVNDVTKTYTSNVHTVLCKSIGNIFNLLL